MTAVNFTKKTLWHELAYFVYQPLFAKQNRPIWILKPHTKWNLSSRNPSFFGDTKSTDNGAMGSWTDGHIFEKTIFRAPLPQIESIKKGVGKNTHAFCLGRTESFPAVIFILKCLPSTLPRPLWLRFLVVPPTNPAAVVVFRSWSPRCNRGFRISPPPPPQWLWFCSWFLPSSWISGRRGNWPQKYG